MSLLVGTRYEDLEAPEDPGKVAMSARILNLHYWNKETYFLKTNIYILTSIDGANDVNAADACTVQPFFIGYVD